MDTDHALDWLDALVLDKTGHRLNELQRQILMQVWQGRRYFDIANDYGCTEGHAKDVGAQLWKSLSEVLGEKITKQNCRSVTERCLNKARNKAQRIKRKIGSTIEQWGLSQPVDLPTLEDVTDLETTDTPDTYTFVGRAGAIAHLSHLFELGHRVVVIQGEGGLGKTTLAQQFLAHRGVECILELFIAKEPQTITPIEQVVEEWLKQDLGEEAGTDFGISLSRLKRHLRDRPIGILIDNLEPALDSTGSFIAPHRNYGELLRVLGNDGIRAVTLVTSRDRLCEPGVNLTHYRLPGLDISAWETYVGDRPITLHPPTLQAMHRAYGGNAKAMGILCGVIQEDFGGDMAAYWQLHQGDLLVAPDLRNLVTSQVDRIQSLVPEAYRLFCRMGCYRYQTVPHIPMAGVLAMLWDVPPSQRQRVITALKNRSLLECQGGTYSLHPSLQTEAIARLRPTPDWERAHREAAEFWTARITRIETCHDALHALEAYYHVIAIDDIEAASQVILKSRVNQWNQFLPLGSTLYRLGLLQPVLDAVTHVIERLTPQSSTPQSSTPHFTTPYIGELHNILGDLRWITGKVNEAIAAQNQAIQIATQQLHPLRSVPLHSQDTHQHYYLTMLAIDSSLSIGLYHIDLWELDIAATQFEHVIQQAQNTRHHAWAEKAMVCLALVQSYQGKRSPARALADQVFQTLLKAPVDSVGRMAYFLQVLGQAYISLDDPDKAGVLLDRALSAAETGHYLQIQGRAMTGLGAIARNQNQFEQAIAHHTDAISRLEQIGAVCDLAEAHVQCGITYQQLDNSQHCCTHFETAITLFQRMNAPQQVQRVRERKGEG